MADNFKKQRSTDVVFQGNDYLDSEINMNKEIVNDRESEELGDRTLRKLKQSHKNVNKVNSGS